MKLSLSALGLLAGGTLQPFTSDIVAANMLHAFETVRRDHPQLMILRAEPKAATEQDAQEAIKILRPFIGNSQLSAIRHGMKGEEGQYFFDKLAELAALVSFMPKVYEQGGKGDASLVTLHYFTGGCDWWITERDITIIQHQAFGLACVHEAELGYISLQEITRAGAELDMHFAPRTLGEVKTQRGF